MSNKINQINFLKEDVASKRIEKSLKDWYVKMHENPKIYNRNFRNPSVLTFQMLFGKKKKRKKHTVELSYEKDFQELPYEKDFKGEKNTFKS